MKALHLLLICCASLLLVACARPFDSYHQPSGIQRATFAGAATGAVASAATSASFPAMVLGGTAIGGLIGSSKNSIAFTQIYNEGGNVVMVGDKIKIMLSSDQLFVFNTDRIDSKQYPLLNDVSRLLVRTGINPITVAAYSDNIGAEPARTMLAYKQAQAISAYLWAHGLNTHRLHPVAMASLDPIAANNRVNGRAYNRRIEITVRDRG